MRPEHVEAFAAQVALNIKSALAPLQERIAVQAAQIADLQARVQDDVVTKELGSLRERVAIVETRPPVPGPPGDPGAPGQDGKDGKPGLEYVGVYQEGKAYEKGHVVTWAGQMYHCHKDGTTAKPEEFGPDWQLCVKRGRDGKAAK